MVLLKIDAGDKMISVDTLPKLDIDQVNIRQSSRNIENLRDEAIYIFNISVHGGTCSFGIKWNHLGLSQETIKALKENNAQPTRIKFFNSLQKKLNQLTYLRKKIQSKLMIYSEPYWFVPESKFEEVSKAVSELKETALVFKEEILQEYEEEKGKYIQIVKEILETITTEESKESIQSTYLSAFPTYTQIHSSFYIELFGPIRIPSIKEQSLIDAELAESELRGYKAKALLELECQFKKSLQTKLTEAVQEASSEFCSILAENLSLLEGLESEGLSDHKKSKLLEAVERCKNLVSFENSLEDVAEQFNEISGYAHDKKFIKMSEAINKLREKLTKENDHLISSNGKGHRALAEWLS